jgi:quaternary ammonium compound-resistance protein SugE
MVSAWLYLIVAALFETGWAIGLEYSEGFTNLWPSVATVISMAISVLLLAKAVQSLPIGTAYAVWTGIGAAATALLGIILFNESSSVARLGFIGLIVVGVVGLEVTGH